MRHHLPLCSSLHSLCLISHSCLGVYRCYVDIILITTMLQASNKSHRQSPSCNWVSAPIAWPPAASLSAVSLKFLHVIEGKDELICTDSKQDQNTGFPNPSFFYQRWRGAFYPCGRERKRELFHASPVPLFLWRFFFFLNLYLPHFSP